MHSAVYRRDAIIVAVFLTSEVQVQWYYTDAIPITTTSSIYIRGWRHSHLNDEVDAHRKTP